MNKHSKSLSISILLHTLLLASIFYTYNEFSSSSGEKKEKRVCIRLGCITESAKPSVKHNKVQKKQVKVQKEHVKVPKKQVKVPKKQVKVPKKQLKVPKKHLVKKRAKPKPHVTKIPKKILPPDKVETLEQESEVKILSEEKIVQQKTSEEIVSECPNKMAHKNAEKEKNRQRESLQSQYVNMHLATIAQLLQENLYYPRRARKRGIEGKVIVKFTLQKDAEVIDIIILSSENDILSRGARKTLQNLSGEFPKPDEALTLTVPISYSLH